MDEYKDDDLGTLTDFYIETDIIKLQGLAIKVDKVLREELVKADMMCGFFEARVYIQ